MKKLRNLIIIISFILILLLTIIFGLIIINSKNQEDIDLNQTSGENIIESNNNKQEIDVATDVYDIDRFNTIENCIQQYYDMNNNKNVNFFEQDENGKSIKVLTDEEINQNRLDLLDSEYVQKNNININNINDYIKTSEEKEMVIVLKMKEKVGTIKSKYLAYGYTINLNYEIKNVFYMYVNLDTTQKTFSVEPINTNKNIKEIELENDNKSIEKNDNNTYTEIKLSDEKIAKKYFLTYKQIIFSNSKIAYAYLDEEYKNEKFGSYENFQKYIEENKKEILGIKFEEYFVKKYDDYLGISFKDQNGKIYTFIEEKPMDFTLKITE